MPTTPPSPRTEAQPDEIATVEHLLKHFESLETQLAAVRESLHQSHRLATLGTVAAAIAHEYHNLLTPVISYAEFALSCPSDQALAQKALQRALAGARQANRISQSMLGLAREVDEAHTASVTTALQEALACLGRDPKKERVELSVDASDLTLAIAPSALQQVFLNLLLNAMHAMAGRGGKLHISAQTCGHLGRVEIRDTGPGVPPEIEDRLFEPFVTHPLAAAEARAGKPPRKGTGLGLSICRNLIRDAGGTLRYRRPPEGGAAFEITLPLADDIFSIR